MPSITKGLVLVTGASGFLAVHVVLEILKQGFDVRGTVRSADKGEYLAKLVAGYKLPTKFEYVVVPDMQADDAFTKAVVGVDAVAHTASPFHYRVEDPYKDLIDPAVNGTLNILNAAAKETSVQRIVLMSSFASIVEKKDSVYNFTEEDWNNQSPALVEAKGKDTPPAESYRASKTLAEKAAWDFIAQKKPHFDLVAINAPLILGPVLQQVPGPDAINTSVNVLWPYLTGTAKAENASAFQGGVTDVRDVAYVFGQSLLKEEAGGNRFLVSTTTLTVQDLLDVLLLPSNRDLIKEFPQFVKGNPGTYSPLVFKMSSFKAQKAFNWIPASVETMVTDTVASLVEKKKDW